MEEEEELIDPVDIEQLVQKKKKNKKRVFTLLGFLFFAAILTFRVWGPNTKTGENGFYLCIPTNSNFNTVIDSLKANKILKSEWAFKWLAKQKNYPNNIKPGRYHIKNAMSNNILINMLRSGDQEPVDVMFNSVRTRQQLAAKISEQLECDSASLMKAMADPSITGSLGFTPDNIMSIFIPNTYEVYWNYSAEEFLRRMYDEFNKFWSTDKLHRAKETGLKPDEIMTLASIVEQETTKDDEKARIAGVYINRLKKGIPLEADPTLIFAIGDFSIKRVLNTDKQVESPYNTYKYLGLPPGPICLPTITTIIATLNYENHQYVFFCAKDDLSGYHSFARSLEQHNENAHLYQEALNGLNIKR